MLIHILLYKIIQAPNIENQCCLDFMEDQDDFYKDYKEAMENKTPPITPLNYSDIHYGLLENCVKPELNKNHDNGNLLPQSDDNSHCEIYTDKCFSGSEISFENCPNLGEFIDRNVDNLAMCQRRSRIVNFRITL